MVFGFLCRLGLRDVNLVYEKTKQSFNRHTFSFVRCWVLDLGLTCASAGEGFQVVKSHHCMALGTVRYAAVKFHLMEMFISS